MKIFMFHDVGGSKNLYFPDRFKIRGLLDIDNFNEKLSFIIKNYKIINFKKYINKEYDDKEYDKLAILTFDDGLKDHYDTVFPILKKNNIVGSFFLSGLPLKEKKVLNVHKIQFIVHSGDNKKDILSDTLELLEKKYNEDVNKLWKINSKTEYSNNNWSSYEIFMTKTLRNIKYEDLVNILFKKYVLKEKIDELNFCEQFYLSEQEILEMKKGGMEFGCHGYYHNSRDNQDTLKITNHFLLNMNIEPLFFSYPNGNIYDIKNLNFKIGLTTENRSCNKEDNNLLLPRINCFNISNGKKIVLCGIQQQGIEIIKYLSDNGILVTDVVTINKESSIKNKASGWVDYEDFCKNYNIKLHFCKSYKLNHEEDINLFKREKFDLLLLGGWQRIIPECILKTLKYGGIGQHGSSEILPRGRGRSPINWSVITDRKRIVWNIFFIKPGIDDGDIIDYKVFSINKWDTCKTIYYKVSIAIKKMYLENIPKIFENKIFTKKQSGIPTFYEKRTPEDGLINWNNSVMEIYNLVRGVTEPYPGAFSHIGLEKIFIWEVQPFEDNFIYENKDLGEIVEVFDEEYVVNCKDGTLLVKKSSYKTPYTGDTFS